MSDSFNPYHKWLGIPLKDQPANHYRLLGVVRFESDPDVITGASDQRVHFLRTLQNGDRGKMVDKLLNEIANAKVCLLDAEKKAAYDQTIRKPAAAEEESTPQLLFQADAEPRAKRRGKTTRPSRRTTARRDNATDEADQPRRGPLVIAIPVIVLMVLLITGVMLFTSSQNAKKEAALQAEIVKKETKLKAEAEAARNAKAKHAQAEANRKLKAEADRIAKAEAERKDKEESERRVKRAEQRARIAEQKLKRAEALNAARASEKAIRKAKEKTAQEAKKQAQEEASIASNTRPSNPKVKQNTIATSKERVEAIELLKKEGLIKGKKGWIPEEMGQRLTKFEEEVVYLQKKGFTPVQVQEIDELKNRYYQKRFAAWSKLHEKGLARARAKGLERGSWSLPTPEAEMHRYLDSHLLAPQFRGEKPPLMPDAVMQDEATTAALKYLTKQNSRYLMTADAQRKKKEQQMKTMVKKIRMRIRSLQKEPEVQVALETLGSKFDPRFALK